MSFDEDYAVDEPIDTVEEHEEEEFAEPIAVIAFTGKFPGAADTETFWSNLRDGVESVKFFTDEELAGENIDPEILANPKFVRADAVLDDIDQFDAEFFNYSPREAEIMDPQHRLFMACSWEAMELAGYNPETYKGRVGVFGGSGLSSYLIRNLLKNSEFVDSVGSFQTMLGNSQDFLATKVSYKMNLMGPSLNTNTLCSSSSVSVHLACQSLWNYQTDMNLAGGVSIQISRNEAFFYQEGGIGAFDGHCRAFDERAGGTVSGSGLGILVLKRLEDAEADGDTIHALIVGSAVNNDGSVKMSYTAPSIDGQAEVIGEAMSVGGIDPETISYVECHGTGTSLGDPVEISGLTKAFRAFTDKKGYCAVGSVKTNIGHLVTAGGVASMIKTVMAMKHRMIPPSLNYERPNPKIDFVNSPFYVVDKLTPWEVAGDVPLRAGVSSFGIGGTNAHQIFEEAPPLEPTDPVAEKQILPISARTEEALAQAAGNLARFLEKDPDINLADAAYTLQLGRKHFGYRRFVVAENAAEAVEQLQAAAAIPPFQEAGDRQAVFMFSGQGSQYAAMGRGLYERLAVFREQVDYCAGALSGLLGLDLRDLLYPAEAQLEAAGEKLAQTLYTQSALFTIEYAMAKQLMAWGIQPKAMIGHSIGEYVAATLAGVFTLDDALTLVANRGRLIQGLPHGRMLAVPMSEKALMRDLPEGLSLATINGPENCVVSGEEAAVTAFANSLEARGVQGRVLHTSHAFHSHMTAPILAEFTELVRGIARKPPQIPYVSNLTGTWITEPEATDPQYYANHLRNAVRFSDGLKTLLSQGAQILLEVGPGRTLATLAKQAELGNSVTLQTMRHPRENREDQQFLKSSVGQLWQQGAAIDWRAIHGESVRRRIPLPTYPFQRRSYWIEPDMDRQGKVVGEREVKAGVRKDNMRDWFYTPSWQVAPLVAPAKLENRRTWLLFNDDAGLGAGLARRLQDETQNVVSVSEGRGFSRLDDGFYQIDATKAEDFNALMKDLGSRDIQIDQIVYLFGLNDKTDRAEHDFAQVSARTFNSLLNLGQSLSGLGAAPKAALTVITANCQEVSGEPGTLSGAMVPGFLRVLNQEMPTLTTRTIDLTPPAGSIQATKWVSQLMRELITDDQERVVAYQNQRRFVQGFNPVALENNEGGLRQGGSYLIVGGLRGLGLEIADHLAQAYGARLTLTGDADFPAHDQWPTLAMDHSDRAAVERLRLLEQKAAALEICPGANLEDLVQGMSRLDGVVYAEGLYGRQVFQTIGETTAETCQTHFSAKLPGLFALERALSERETDFCVVLSSVSSVLGGLGLAAMAASHGCVDAFVRRHNQSFANQWTTMSWDGWVILAGGEAAGSQAAGLTLTMAEGMEAFTRITTLTGVDQVILSSEDLPARLRLLNLGHTDATEPAEKQYTVHPRPHLQNPYVAPRNETEEKIAEIWSARLGIEEVGINDNFFDLGGDSLIVVKIRNALKETFPKELLTSDLFEYPTVAALADFYSKDTSTKSIKTARNRAQKRRSAMDQGNMEGLFSPRRKRNNG